MMSVKKVFDDTLKFTTDIEISSRGDGVTSAFSKLRPIWISHLYYFFSKNGKIKMTKKMAKRNSHHWHHLTRQPLAPICFSN